jgi:U3 small nucleolar RNA-associated protein 10
MRAYKKSLLALSSVLQLISSPTRSLTSEDSLALLSAILMPRPAPDSDEMMTLPSTLIPILLGSCFAAILSDSNATSSALQRPLGQVYQRYPAVWTAQSAVYTARAKASSDETAVSRLMQAMNGVLGGSSDSTSALVLSASAPDVALRVQALKDILKDAETIEAQGNGAFVHDTLVARLAEPEHDIAQVLFAKSTLGTMHKVLAGDEILAAMQPALQTSRDKYLALALAYLAGPFVQHFPDQADAVVQQVFWPRLLATKTDARKHAVAASALRGSKLEQTHAWLKGTTSALVTKQEDVTAETNDKIVEAVAKNLAASGAAELDTAISFLLQRVGANDKLAIVVALRLASKVEKSRRVDFVSKVLHMLRVVDTGLDVVATEESPLELVSDANSGALSPAVQQALYARSGDDKTIRLLQGALIVGGLKSVHPVKEASWSWLSSAVSSEEVVEYRVLCRDVYKAAHSHSGSKGAQALSNALLETLFGALVTEDAIAFLASIYTDAAVPVELRVAALRDAAVFIEVLSAATAKPKGKLVDWQVTIPSLVVALADVGDDKRVRVEALKTLAVAQSNLKVGQAAKVGSVYGRDKFYGEKTTSAHLKYLELADVTTYLDKLLASKAELTLSPTHLRILHASILDAASEKESPKKRKQVLSAKVAAYLVSHVACWKTSLSARIRLLQALEGVKDKEKSVALVALVAEAIEAGPAQVQRDPEAETEYARLVLAPYDGASRKWLEGEDTQAVEVLVTAVEVQDIAGERATPTTLFSARLLTPFSTQACAQLSARRVFV